MTAESTPSTYPKAIHTTAQQFSLHHVMASILDLNM